MANVFATFRTTPAAGRMLLTHPLPADTDLLALHRQAPARYPLLMESVAAGTVQGRWDLLLVAAGGGLRLDADGVTRDLDGQARAGTFLQALDVEWTAAKLKEFGLAHLIGAHCTGVEAVYRLREVAGLSRKTAVVGAVGSSFSLEGGIDPLDLAR